MWPSRPNTGSGQRNQTLIPFSLHLISPPTTDDMSDTEGSKGQRPSAPLLLDLCRLTDTHTHVGTHTDDVAEVQSGECASYSPVTALTNLDHVTRLILSAKLDRFHLHQDTHARTYTQAHALIETPPALPPSPVDYEVFLKSNDSPPPPDKRHTFHWNTRGFYSCSTRSS